MSWKDWPYWLKGGLIFFSFSLIYIFNKIRLYQFDINCYPVMSTHCDYVYLTGLPMPTILQNFSANWKEVLPHFLMILVIGTIIGVIVGWVYGKIKSKKQ